MKHPDRFNFAVETIYKIFEPHLDRPNLDAPVTHIKAARFFEALGKMISRPVLYKAKAALGIRSRKIAGEWVWMLPRNSPESIAQKLHKVRLDSISKAAEEQRLHSYELYRGSVEMLRDRIEACHYDCLAREILAEFKAWDYCALTAYRAKKIVGMISVKKSDGWHWIWPAEPVQLWLETHLGDEILPVEEIFQEAWEQHEWTRDVVRAARTALGGIGHCWIDKKYHWYDINKTGPPVTARTLALREKSGEL